MPEQQDRIGRLEARQWEQQEQISRLESRMSSLETSRDNERTRHATTPAWLFGIISAGIGLVMLLLNLYLAGLRP